MPTTVERARRLFSPAEIEEIAARAVQVGENRSLDAIELAVSWASRVEKIDLDRALTRTDRTVWNEHDLVGSLFVRDFLQQALDGLPPALRERLAVVVAGADERFRSYTVEDAAGRIGKVAEVDLAGRPWWWSRVPGSGPITQDLARY